MGTLHKIEALRSTAARLRDGAPYQWGHAGMCNCGHLAQTVTSLDTREIYRMVNGEWSEHLNTACAATGLDLGDVAARMVQFGFSMTELADLEQLRDRSVLARLDRRPAYLRRNERDDVILYLSTWADMLQEAMDAQGDSPATPEPVLA